jgi:ABC-type lipoprotein export system ATPase subunit
MSAIRGENLTKTVKLPRGQQLSLLNGVDIDVARGESVALRGRSGSGKTTLLAILGLLASTEGGRLTIAGRDMTSASEKCRCEVRSTLCGFVFQSYSLIGHLTAAENVELPLLQGAAVSRSERRARTSEALELMGLADRARSRPWQLSGGEQQRVAIARSIVRSPAVVLADEPTGALDVETGAAVIDILLTAVRRRDAALVVVTHDSAIASRMARRYVLEDGRLHPDRDHPPTANKCG